MGAGTDAGIVAVAPVDQVVPALGAGPGVVRGLVGGEAGALADLLGGEVHVGGEARVGQPAEPAAGREVAEAGAGLDGELVEREMVDRHRERAVEF